VTEAQRQPNGSYDETENYQIRFAEGKHGIFGSILYFNALRCLTKVFGER